ncbi:MAG: LysM peptidoglycan-binding domain-containing protein [Bacteroidota bacterium]
MKYLLGGILCIAVAACSSGPSTRTDDIFTRMGEIARTSAPSTSDTTLSTFSPLSSPQSSTPGLAEQPAQSLPDSLVDESILIAQKLEIARQHYLVALGAQEARDSTLSQHEFEQAIEILNELSYFPDVESNKDFIDLSRSVIEDYEKYIALINDLGPEASIFALREKLNVEIEISDPSRIEIPKYDIVDSEVALPYNEYVERVISFFMNKGREHFERWLHLEGRYFPMMRRIFREEGVPGELVYLSMPESGLRPDARSWAKAVGLWQFMKGTGALYGLRSNWWYDERRDFEKSTRAAARHMKDLYQELGDWHLVLAAYNSGAGRVYRAIRKAGSTDYWKIRPHLPRETRNYVPQYIAVVRMAVEPQVYGFHVADVAEALNYDVVEIDDCIDLKILATCAETDLQSLKDLNPELLQWCTPPGVTGYRLRIPSGKKEIFEQKYAGIPDEQKRDWAIHKVKKGETLSTIARRYGLNTGLLREVNTIRNERALAIGASLTIPLPSGALSGNKVPFNYERDQKTVRFGKGVSAALAARTSTPRTTIKAPLKTPAGKNQLVYSVKRGDTIGHIAEWYGVRTSDIRNWNNIAYGSFIRTGQQLKVWVSPDKAALLSRVDAMSLREKQGLKKGEVEEATVVLTSRSNDTRQRSQGWVRHIVRSGDALEIIARDYGVSVNDLKSWNGLRGSRITVGQKLEIYGEPEERARVISSTAPDRAQVPGGTNGHDASRGNRIHNVKRGETLSTIARVYGLSARILKEYNNLRSSMIRVDQKLKIPDQMSATSQSLREYNVRRGDTLWDIAQKFGVSVQELKRQNDVAENIRPGDTLIIPGQ